jgi:hypothetical protein
MISTVSRFLPPSALPDATRYFSAPLPWNPILRPADLIDFLCHQIDFPRLAGKQNIPFRTTLTIVAPPLRRVRHCDML